MLPDIYLPRRAWLIVGLLWVVGCLNYLDRVMLITMRLSIKEAIPMTDAQFGLLTTVFLLVYSVLCPLGGFLADRYSCSRIIIFSLCAWSGITWLTAHATTFSELLVSRALMGVSEACYLPAAGALIANYHKNATRSLANGIHLSGVMVGSGLGGLGGLLAEKYSWSFAFQLFGVIGVVYSAILIAFLRDLPVETSATRGSPASAGAPEPAIRLIDSLRSLFSRGHFILALLFWALLGITSWAFTGWMPTYLSEHFNLPQGKAGLIATGFIYSGALVGMVVSGAWADRWSRTHPEGRAWVGLIGLAVCVPCVLLVANTSIQGVAMAGLVVYGLTRAFPDANMMPILFQITDHRYRATALGLLNGCGTLAGGITIYVGGALRDAHVDITRVFYGGAIGLSICALLLWIIRPRTIPAN
ncbi:MAG: Sugar phosphate permease [Verrucomicrobia bacterium]|nr:Sugar phosphate permease [Verrucomicrobiota bacterium]